MLHRQQRRGAVRLHTCRFRSVLIGRLRRVQRAQKDTGLTDAGLRQIATITSLRELYIPATSITAAGLVYLRQLPRLSVLLLEGKAITDIGLRECCGLVHLERLGIPQSSISDAGLTSLVNLEHLVALELAGSPVTDEGLVHVGQLTNLEYLGLSQTQITDEGLAYLRGLVNLRHLDLTGTRVTDAGLMHLHGLDKLRQLGLDGTQVTDKSVSQRLANKTGTLVGVGDPAPDVSITRLDGTDVRLSELHGKVVCLNFFATWCGPCRMEMPHLQKMWQEFCANEGFTMLVVSREEPQEIVESFRSEQHLTCPMARDPDRSAFNQFATEGIPRTYLISRDGTILYQSVGYYEGLYEQELAKLKRLVDAQLKRLP